MKDQDEFLENIVIDVCKRTFMMYSDDGSKRKVQCDTTKQFMEVLALVLTNADPDIVEYADCLLYTSPSPRDLSTSRMPSSA